MSGCQLFAPLDELTERALRDSIRTHGVLVPIHKDQHGRTLDGHHRERIAAEEGVAVETVVVHVASEEHGRQLAFELNTARRQLTREQRRAAVAALHENGHSQRAIALALGAPKATVQHDVERLRARVSVDTPDAVVGLDGKRYKAVSRTPAAAAQRAERARQLAAEGHTSRQIAAALKLSVAGMANYRKKHGLQVPADALAGHPRRDPVRVVRATIEMVDGIGRGLDSIDAAVLPAELCAGWAAILRESISALRSLQNKLTKRVIEERQAQQ